MKRGENEKWISMSMQEISYNMSNEKNIQKDRRLQKRKKEKVKEI